MLNGRLGIGKRIGKGGEAEVFLVTESGTTNQLAMKVIEHAGPQRWMKIQAEYILVVERDPAGNSFTRDAIFKCILPIVTRRSACLLFCNQ